MGNRFDPYARNYQSLSVADLLDAREAYHIHLTHLDHVFATAIGRFRIRNDDHDATESRTVRASKQRGKRGPRTFANTMIRPWSWPCILVFVDHWLSPNEIRKPVGHLADQIVPPFLYLPDGRVVPTCVMEADPSGHPREDYIGAEPASPILASGQPIVTTSQSQDRVGTVTCVVFDGQKYYAMTNQHVAGSPGTEVRAYMRGEQVVIGKTVEASLKKRVFDQIYPGLAGHSTLVNLDVGLVEIDDLNLWSSNLHGLGPNGGTAALGKMLEFRSDTASLEWIGTRVIGYGAASGEMRAQIKALFYRYRTLGGIDYTADFLLGDTDFDPEIPATKTLTVPFETHPGDSGALWCIDPSQLTRPESSPKVGKNDSAGKPHQSLLRPFAIQWGGQKLSAGPSATYTSYGLATSLAVACRELDVEVVADWQTDHPEYWGAIGHYKIAQGAVSQVKSNLSNFMTRHMNLLTFPNLTKKPTVGNADTEFIPLADVPDLVWKTNINKTPDKHVGKAGRPLENPNHYADIDLLDNKKRRLIDVCGVDPAAWQTFYVNAPVPKAGLKQKAKKGTKPAKAVGINAANQGLLPFRVAQIFGEMAQFCTVGDADKYLCAAGIVAHYVGDACQPLHGSRHADGLDGTSTGVHSTYEEKMVDANASDLADLVEDEVKKLGALPTVRTPQEAAERIVELMKKVRTILPPEDICNAYMKYRKDNGLSLESKSSLSSAVPTLWNKFGGKTAQCIALGIHYLAGIWQGAYDAGKPDPAKFKKTYDGQSDLLPLYTDKEFLKSYHLNEWIQVFWKSGQVVGSGPSVKKTAKKTVAKKSAKRGKKG